MSQHPQLSKKPKKRRSPSTTIAQSTRSRRSQNSKISKQKIQSQSPHSSADKRHVNFSFVNSGIGIKLDDDSDFQTSFVVADDSLTFISDKSNSSISSSSKSSKSQKSVSPKSSIASSSSRRGFRYSNVHQNKHKVWVYETKMRKTCSTLSSPYLCEVVKKHQNERASHPTEYKEIYVSDREYKLLQAALRSHDIIQKELNKTKNRPAAVGVNSLQRTLFGYVNSSPQWAGGSTKKKSKKSIPVSSKLLAQSIKSKRPPGLPTLTGNTFHFDHTNYIDVQMLGRSIKKHQEANSRTGVPRPESAPVPLSYDSYEIPLTLQDMNLFLKYPADDEKSEIIVPSLEDFENKSKNNWGYINDVPIEELVEEHRKVGQVLKSGSEKEVEQTQCAVSDTLLEERNPSVIVKIETLPNLGHYERRAPKIQNNTQTSPDQIDIRAQTDTPTQADSPTQTMITTMLATSEASVMLMNTLFKGALDDPNSSKVLKRLPFFQEFVNVRTEVEALKKASIIFCKASESIDSYLTNLKLSTVKSSKMSKPGQKLKLNQKSESISGIYVKQSGSEDIGKECENDLENSKSLDLETEKCGVTGDFNYDFRKAGHSHLDESEVSDDSDDTTGDTSRLIKSTEKVYSDDENGGLNQQDLNWALSNLDIDPGANASNSESNKQSFPVTAITTSNCSGLLQQAISCKDYECKLNFIGTSRTVKSLMSSRHTKSKTIALTAVQLIEMLDETLPFIVNRLYDTKQRLLVASKSIGTVVEDYNLGKFGRYSKSMKKAMMKLRGLNIFAGIILQMSKVFTSIFDKLQDAMDILSQLQDILKSSNSSEKENRSVNATFDNNRELNRFISDIENVIEIGKNSLAGIQEKTLSLVEQGQEVKMKKFLREIVGEVFLAALELNSKNNIDFSSLIISSVCNTKQLVSVLYTNNSDDQNQGSSSASTGTVSAFIQRGVLNNLNKVQGIVRDLQNISGRMTLASTFLATKSLLNLKRSKEAIKLTEEKKSQLKFVPWYRRRLFSQLRGRSYSLVSVPSPGSSDPVLPVKEILPVSSLNQNHDCGCDSKSNIIGKCHSAGSKSQLGITADAGDETGKA